jgi:IS605 OrfB family transposase
MGRRAGVKVEIAPTRAQAALLAQFAGAGRFAYNWSLERQDEHYHEVVLPARARGEKMRAISAIDLDAMWKARRAADAPWYHKAIPAYVALTAQQDAAMALSRFLDGKARHPRFKRRGKDTDSFRLRGDRMESVRDGDGKVAGSRVKRAYQVTSSAVYIERIGMVRTKEDATRRLPPGTRVTSATFSREPSGRWYASLAVEYNTPDVIPSAASAARVIGIDPGIMTFATLSDGSVIEAPARVQDGLAAVSRANRSVARKRNVRDGAKTARARKREAHQAHKRGEKYWPDRAEKRSAQAARREERKARQADAAARLAALRADAAASGKPAPAKVPRERRAPERKSRRMEQAEQVLRNAHRRAGDVRENWLHEQSTRLVRRAARSGSVLSLEDPNIKGMMSRRGFRLGRRLQQLGLAEFARQVKYKAVWSGVPVHVSDRFYPSSKRCSRCGSVKADLALSERTYRCAQCGLIIGRDLNAARNHRADAIRELTEPAAVAAARGGSTRRGAAAQDPESPAREKSRRLAPRRRAADVAPLAQAPEQVLSDAPGLP